MNRVSTNPKCAYSFFKSDANTMSSACEQYAWMYKHWKITLKCKTSLHVYTCICIVYRDMHYLKHAYTCICMVYCIPAGGQDSRCESGGQPTWTGDSVRGLRARTRTRTDSDGLRLGRHCIGPGPARRSPSHLSSTGLKKCPSAKWGVHILHIEIVFACFAY